MKDYVIMTDSCCDLPNNYIEKYNIPYVPLTYNLEGKEYIDNFGQNLDYKDFYREIEQGKISKTSQPSTESYCKIFKEFIDKDKDIIYICVSSGLSGTYNGANIAKNMILEEYPDAKIVIIDTLTASLGQGLLVIKAIEMKEQGENFDDIVKYLEEIKFNLNTYLTVDDLNHLKRGGRISSAAALFGMVLHIKPILTINNEGKVIPALKAKGRKNAITKLCKFACEKFENPEEEILMISHGDAKEEAEKLKELILKDINVKEVIINNIGPVVGTYGGPKALAIFFLGKHRQNHIIEINK